MGTELATATMASSAAKKTARSMPATRYSGDTEKAPARAIGYKGKDDPFGDEKDSEVKYKTMAWW